MGHLGNLGQCPSALTGQNFFLISKLKLPFSGLKPLPLVLSLQAPGWKVQVRSPWSLMPFSPDRGTSPPCHDFSGNGERLSNYISQLPQVSGMRLIGCKFRFLRWCQTWSFLTRGRKDFVPWVPALRFRDLRDGGRVTTSKNQGKKKLSSASAFSMVLVLLSYLREGGEYIFFNILLLTSVPVAHPSSQAVPPFLCQMQLQLIPTLRVQVASPCSSEDTCPWFPFSVCVYFLLATQLDQPALAQPRCSSASLASWQAPRAVRELITADPTASIIPHAPRWPANTSPGTVPSEQYFLPPPDRNSSLDTTLDLSASPHFNNQPEN